MRKPTDLDVDAISLRLNEYVAAAIRGHRLVHGAPAIL